MGLCHSQSANSWVLANFPYLKYKLYFCGHRSAYDNGVCVVRFMGILTVCLRLFLVLLFVSSGLRAEEPLACTIEEVEVLPEDFALTEQEPEDHQETLSVAHSTVSYPCAQHMLPASGGDDFDLKKLWDMLTEGMSSCEKKAYAQEFLAIAQQHQERMMLRDATDSKVLFAKIMLVLAAIGVVVYIIYAIIAASQQETERGRQRAKVDKVTAQTAATQAAAAAGASAQAMASLKVDIDDLKKKMAEVDAQVNAELERARDSVFSFHLRINEELQTKIMGLGQGVNGRIEALCRSFETSNISMGEEIKKAQDAAEFANIRITRHSNEMKELLDKKFKIK